MSRFRMARVLSGLACLVLALPGGKATANGPRIGFSAGTIFPMASDSVQLAKETVVVKLSDPRGMGEGRVACKYYLRNLANSTQVLSMAFSVHGYLDDSTTYRHLDFSVTAHGQELPVRFFKTDDPRWAPFVDWSGNTLPVWDLSLAPRELLQLEIRYQVFWAGDDEWNFKYNARPAALWAGKIEDAQVSFEFDMHTAQDIRRRPGDPKHVEFAAHPDQYRWSGNRVIWEFQMWEPTDDVSVILKPEEH